MFGRASTGVYTIAGILTIVAGLWVNKYIIANQAYLAAGLGFGTVTIIANVLLVILCENPLTFTEPETAPLITPAEQKEMEPKV